MVCSYALLRLGDNASHIAKDGVRDFGLFLAFDLERVALVKSSGSPSGYGSRRLTPGELGSLGDVPILFLDTLSTTEGALIMAEICKSPPSKLLHTRSDVLLTRTGRV